MSKRRTFMQGPVSKPPRSPAVEAARFLASAARRYLEDRGTPREIDEAIACWREAREKPTSSTSSSIRCLCESATKRNPDCPIGLRFGNHPPGTTLETALRREWKGQLKEED
jgi:hypothetical protein